MGPSTPLPFGGGTVVDYEGLIDAEVRPRGNGGPLFNHRKQMAGAASAFPIARR
jgi:hypothetical protein